jgi:hypothetical protein
LSESNSSGRGANSEDEENREGIDGEEEEEENPLPATQASRTGWVMTRRQAGQKRNRCTRTLCRSTTSITHRRRQFTTFCKHKVVENIYGCLQNVVRKQFVYNILQAESSGKPLRLLEKRRQKAVPRAEERTATTRRTSRGSTGRKRRKKILFQRLRKKRRKVTLTWKS